jgi:hypothetical protein
MGLGDDGPYIATVRRLAATGHIAYTGWATAMLGWQLYLADAFVKLFGFSFTAVRMSTLLVGVALAFLLHRTMVRSGIGAMHATFGTLTVALSPLFLTLSVTFMTDIQGIFAVTLCLYACLRALQAATSNRCIAWLCFAIAANVVCGSSRQIAWLGVLVMVPSTLWLLRDRSRVLFAGAAATLAGALSVLCAMRWFQHQPYSIPEHLLPPHFPVLHMLLEFIKCILELPFLLLPIAALFLFDIRKHRPRTIAIVFVLLLGYLFLAVRTRFHDTFVLEPAQGLAGDWICIQGVEASSALGGIPPLFIHTWTQLLLAFVSMGGLLGLLLSLLRRPARLPAKPAAGPAPVSVSWTQLGLLLGPFTAAYLLLLIPRATTGLCDRYTLGLSVPAAILCLRFYQERIRQRPPLWAFFLVGIMAVYGIAISHNRFTFLRARVALAAELRAAGVPDTAVDNGWEYNFDVELDHAPSINDDRIVLPAHAYTAVAPPLAGQCQPVWYDKTPHIHARYGVSLDPKACYGLAPFAPVHYARWLAAKPGTLYVVQYLSPDAP